MGNYSCPFCQSTNPPRQTEQMAASGWILFVVLLLFCLPLCWIPFVVSGCKEIVRHCSSCGTRLG